MPRPVHQYRITFTHPLAAPEVLLAEGETYCAAKRQACVLLEARIRDAQLPPKDWALTAREDLGVVSG